MSDEGDDSRFLLYMPGVIDRLEERDFFVRAISQAYGFFAQTFGWNVTLNRRRLFEAYEAWQVAVQQTLEHDTDQFTTKLDHFKNAAFITHALQRNVVVNDIVKAPLGPGETDKPKTASQIQFARYGNEICALHAGFVICLSYETYARGKREGIDPNQLSLQALPAYLQSEYPRLMKHKDIAAPALYMIFRALFDTLSWRIEPPSAG